jgi:hypothetical protein
MRRPATIIIYWMLAVSLSALLLWQENRYLHLPPEPVWYSVDEFLRRNWRAGDQIQFSPAWIASYALDRGRFRDLIGPGPATRNARVWIVSLFSAEVASEREVERHSFEPVTVQLVEIDR